MKEYRICLTYLDTVYAESEDEALEKALKFIKKHPDCYNDSEIEVVEE